MIACVSYLILFPPISYRLLEDKKPQTWFSEDMLTKQTLDVNSPLNQAILSFNAVHLNRFQELIADVYWTNGDYYR